MPEDARPAAHWWRFALGDLNGARALAADDTVSPRLAAALAQQAAEKALKALIALDGPEPPRTHDLVALAARLPSAAAIQARVEALRHLSDAYVSSRYPSPFEPAFDWSEVHELIDSAASIVEDVRPSLERRGFDTGALDPA